ncbi:pimeloyl-ACP methyl ester carboxylesterase [Marmoricola sp. OAE513]|uniref:alpha/beta fold hydrolase n=1 Tax=Marmoricola sp. OAE513 TaxID=2817894 RepID=UPI001AE56130
MRIVLLPGAGGAAAYWDKVVPLLETEGHDAVAVELPADDESAGLPTYVEVALESCGAADDVLVVAQSMGGFTAPMLAERLQAAGRTVVGIVLLNAMVPLPGETPGEWWDAVGSEQARVEAAEAGGYPTDFDLDAYFLHDLDEETTALLMEGGKDEVEAAFVSPCAIAAWPDVPTRVVAGGEDRFFPLALQQRVARERLGVEPTVVPGGHLCALSFPAEVARAVLLA